MEDKKEAKRQYNKKWREAHPDAVKEHARKWAQTHPEYAKRWREEHSEYYKRWREAHPDRARQHARKWREEHPDRSERSTRKWQEGNPDYFAGYHRKQKIKALTHYGNGKCACVRCGFDDIRALSIDHINDDGNIQRKVVKNIYVWLRKNDYPEGYQTLCMNCQFIKRAEN